ncbi:HEAT repeat domain-containing protein [Streptomyces sp. NBC_01361]|uniref:HEAT repeat domain-containing protein n=1 Tax=Streptomyces sp. NBC_01361 TaxID=2903838 RepID=UPI002E35B880|nr:HEAT repeat domain-containing protein [Streptomyces sp. NBC_01361]
MTPLIQLIPREPFGREDIQAFAEENGWTPAEVNQPEGPIEELAWVLGLVDADSPDDTEDVETVVVHWVEDRRFQVDYLAVEGDGAESFADWLRGELPLHSDKSLAEMTASTRDESALMRALRRLGVNHAGREFDRAAYDLLRWALHDPEPLVRRNALLAASVMDWQELVPLLMYVSETENDPNVREQAATTLDIVRDRIARQGSTSPKGSGE